MRIIVAQNLEAARQYANQKLWIASGSERWLDSDKVYVYYRHSREQMLGYSRGTLVYVAGSVDWDFAGFAKERGFVVV